MLPVFSLPNATRDIQSTERHMNVNADHYINRQSLHLMVQRKPNQLKSVKGVLTQTSYGF